MKLIDLYIIKRYIGTFAVMILLFIPIGIMVDVAEKIDKFKEKEVPFSAILEYYIDFTWYFANLLFPIFLFLSVIWFTSKLANNTEVIAILSSGISFFRYLRPFLLAATFIAIFAFFAGMFIVPKSNLGFNDFRYRYIIKKEARNTTKVFQQINDNEFIYVNSYDPIRKRATNFTLEHFDGNELKFKIKSSRIRWIDKDSVFRLSNYSKRTFLKDSEYYESDARKDTLFDFEIQDLAPVNYIAETLTFSELNQFIEDEKELLEMAMSQLQRLGHTVYPAVDIAEAREILSDEKKNIQMVITDHRLPDGLGIQFAIEIKETYPNAKSAIVSGCLTDHAGG